MWYLNIYAAISGAQTAVELLRSFTANFLGIRAARHLHNGMLARLLRCTRHSCQDLPVTNVSAILF